jgi:hypothetical protein
MTDEYVPTLYDKYCNAWQMILKANHSHWEYDGIDFEADHNFPEPLWVRSSNFHCCSDAGRVKVRGKQWRHIWTAINTLCKNKGCDHRFVEGVMFDEGDGKLKNLLWIHFGS